MFHLLDQLPELVLGDHAITVHVEELESLERQFLCKLLGRKKNIKSTDLLQFNVVCHL